MRRILLLCCALPALISCSKPAAPEAPPVVSAPPPAARPAPPPAVSAPAAPSNAVQSQTPAKAATGTGAAGFDAYYESSTEFNDLNKHLEVFLLIEKRMPRDINELVTARRINPPPRPPAGMRLILDRTAKRVRVEKVQ